MHAPRALLLGLLLAVSALAGCVGGAPDESGGTPPTTPTGDGNTTITTPPASTARFQVANVSILAPDGTARTLYEDDDHATVRYVVRQPDDAPGAETAFVTYTMNGRIMDVQQLKLEPGEEKSFERTVSDLRTNKSFRVEVRAGSSSMSANTTVQPWPRAGEDELVLGPMAIRVPYGLMEQDGRVLVNLTLDHRGPEQAFRDFRVKTICLTTTNETQPTRSVDITPPTLGNSTGADVLLDHCPNGYYGLEFKAAGADGELLGRMLLVPDGWRPPTA